MTPTELQRSAWRAAAWIAVGMVVLYPLSIGPAFRLMDQGYVSKFAIDVIYFPLLWLTDQSDAIGIAVAWYLTLW